MGFLDNLNLDDPKTQLLLQMGLGLLGGAPGQRKNFGADLANAGQQGLLGYAGAQKTQRENRTNELTQVSGLYKTLKDIDQQAQSDSLTGMGGPYTPNPHLGQLERRIGDLAGLSGLLGSQSSSQQAPQQRPPMPSAPSVPPAIASQASPVVNDNWKTPEALQAVQGAQQAPQQPPDPRSQFQQMLKGANIPPALAASWMNSGPQGKGQLYKHLSQVYEPRAVNNVLMQLNPDGSTKILGGMMGADTAPVTLGTDGQPKLSPIPGAMDYFAQSAGAKTQATKAAEAKYDTISVPMPDGSTKLMTREQFVGGQPQRSQASPIPNSPLNAPQTARLTVTEPSRGMGMSQTPGDQAQQTELGKYHAQVFVDTQTAGKAAASGRSKLDRMRQLMEGIDTTSATPLGMKFAGWGRAAGVELDPKLPQKEAFQSMAGQLALELRNPAGGAGMPGAMSDSDREFLKSMTPGLAQTPEGRRLMFETKSKLLQRDEEVAQLARSYYKHNKKMDEGFQQILADYSVQHPMFPRTDAQPNQTDEMDALVKKWKSK